jgi:hypothetical protein
LSAQRRLDRLRNTGAWLHAYPCLIEYTYLSAQEYRGALCLWYGLTHPNLPSICNSCPAPFSVVHALDCKKGGLVTLSHNDLCNEIADIAALAYTPTAVQIEPPLFTAILNTLQPGQPIDQSTVAPAPAPPTAAPTNNGGDIAICGLFECGSTAIIDI